MKEVTLDLPAGVELCIPRDYAKHCGGDSVRVLDAAPRKGLTVCWDDAHLEFMSDTGGVSYQRSAILGFRVDRRRQFMHWLLCELQVELADTLLPLLSCDVEHEPVFKSFLEVLASVGVPVV